MSTDQEGNYVEDAEWVWVDDNGDEIKNRPAKVYDEAYISAYCNNPQMGKRAALTACGYVGKYLRQDANRMHNRLRDQIEAKLDEMILDGGHLGHSVLVDLAKHSESDTVKAKVGKDLMDYAGRKPGDKLIVTDARSDDELDVEIARVQKRIDERVGRLDS